MTGDAACLESKRLRTLRSTGLLSASAPPKLDEICRHAKEHFKVTAALVSLIEEHVVIVKARAGTDLERAPHASLLCDSAIHFGKVLVVGDATQDPRFTSHPFVVGEPFVRIYAGMPLTYLREIRIGALCLLDTRPRQFSLGDQAELAQMAEEAVIALMWHELTGIHSDPFS